MTQLPLPPKGFDPEWAAQNNRVIEGRLRGLSTLEQRFTTLSDTVAGDLTAIATLTGTGFLARTADDSWALRTITGPAAGITVTNGAGIVGNPTLALANDLAALEGLASTGIAVRTGTDAWAQRTITGTANEITATNGSGVSGNPTLSLPTALTFTGKTVTGGTFSSGAFNGSVGATTPSTGAFTTISTTDNITVGTAADAATRQITIRSASGQTRRILVQSGTTARWVLAFTNETESGANAGSNFWIERYADDGSFLGFPVQITRSSGAISLGGNTSITGTLSTTGNVTLGDASTDTVQVSGRLFGTNLHNNAGGMTGTSSQYIGSGTYTPTGANQSNVSSITTAKAQFLRVGNVVTVSGTADVTVTSASTFTRFSLTLPIASALSAITDLAGAGTYLNLSAYGAISVYADTASDRVFCDFQSGSAGGVHNVSYHYSYEVL